MQALLRKIWVGAVAIPIISGVVGLASGAAIAVSWSKSNVIPVVLVKPGIGGFEPVDGSSIGNMWSKSDVKAVLLVKPGIAGFEPREGVSIGNFWSKDNVLPVMLVEPSGGGFIPLQTLSNGAEPNSTSQFNESQHVTSSNASASASTIESQIEGDFEGWEGETIVKLTNGQIWQQNEYYYTYHYAFMPHVLIIKSGNGYKMKVDGVNKLIGVIQIR